MYVNTNCSMSSSLLGIIRCLGFCCSGLCKMVTHVGFNLHSLNDYLKHSFIFSPSMKCGKYVLVPIFLPNFIFVRNFLYMLDNDPLSVLCLANSFSQLEAIVSLLVNNISKFHWGLNDQFFHLQLLFLFLILFMKFPKDHKDFLIGLKVLPT